MICGKTVYESMGNLEQQYTKQTNEIKQLITQLNTVIGYLNDEVKGELATDSQSRHTNKGVGNSGNLIESIAGSYQTITNEVQVVRGDVIDTVERTELNIKGGNQRKLMSLRDGEDCTEDINDCTIYSVLQDLQKQLDAITGNKNQLSMIQEQTSNTISTFSTLNEIIGDVSETIAENTTQLSTIKEQTSNTITSFSELSNNINEVSRTIEGINTTINKSYLDGALETYFGNKIGEFIAETGIELDKDNETSSKILMNNKLTTLLLLLLERELKEDFEQTQFNIKQSRPSNRVKLNQSGYKQVKKLLQEDK